MTLNNKSLDIQIINSEDWEGLYVNGKLWGEGHRILLSDLIYAIASYFPITFKTRECDGEWLEEMSSFPDDLSEVKWLGNE